MKYLVLWFLILFSIPSFSEQTKVSDTLCPDGTEFDKANDFLLKFFKDKKNIGKMLPSEFCGEKLVYDKHRFTGYSSKSTDEFKIVLLLNEKKEKKAAVWQLHKNKFKFDFGKLCPGELEPGLGVFGDIYTWKKLNDNNELVYLVCPPKSWFEESPK